MLARSFLIESSSQLLVTRTGIKARSRSIFEPNQTTHSGVTCPWVTKISHFWTWISLKPADKSWSSFMCSIIGVGERLHYVLGTGWPWHVGLRWAIVALWATCSFSWQRFYVSVRQGSAPLLFAYDIRHIFSWPGSVIRSLKQGSLIIYRRGIFMSRLMTKPTKWCVCAQRRLRSAWTSAQSDQSLRCPYEEIVGP